MRQRDDRFFAIRGRPAERRLRGTALRRLGRRVNEASDRALRRSEALGAKGVPVSARVTAERDEPGRTQRREVVMGCGLREPGCAGELVERRVTAREASQDGHSATVPERPPEQHGLLRERRFRVELLRRDRVTDDTGSAVLTEEEERPRGDVRDEHDAVELRLGLVDVPACDVCDQRLRGQRLSELARGFGRGCDVGAMISCSLGEKASSANGAAQSTRRRFVSFGGTDRSVGSASAARPA